MKKLLLLLVLTTCLVLCSAVITPAANTSNLYVDTMIGGTVYDHDILGNGNANETYIGIEFPVDKFKFNIELQTGTWDQDNYADNNFNGYDLKGGYQIQNDRNLQLYITLSDYYRKSDSDQKFSGILLGVDAATVLSRKINLKGSLDFSFNGNYQRGDYQEDASLLQFNAKLYYLLSKKISATLGYRYNGFSLDVSDENIKSQGLTVGLNFKF